ncbi:Glucose starvation-inducible protein B [compost metagenome]
MTVREAGQKGGETVKEKYGPEFYSEIGQKGGEAVKEKYGPEHYSEIGHKGGQRVKDLIEKGEEEEGKGK